MTLPLLFVYVMIKGGVSLCSNPQVYFKLNAINNCKQPLQQIETNRLFDNAKQAHKVTLRCGLMSTITVSSYRYHIFIQRKRLSCSTFLPPLLI